MPCNRRSITCPVCRVPRTQMTDEPTMQGRCACRITPHSSVMCKSRAPYDVIDRAGPNRCSSRYSTSCIRREPAMLTVFTSNSSVKCGGHCNCICVYTSRCFSSYANTDCFTGFSTCACLRRFAACVGAAVEDCTVASSRGRTEWSKYSCKDNGLIFNSSNIASNAC